MGQVLHASHSGHFPFCVPPANSEEIGQYKKYPIAMTKEDAMKAFWRVRTWRISGVELDDEVTPTYYSGNNYTEKLINQESDLVCAMGFSLFKFVNFGPSSFNSDRAEFFFFPVLSGENTVVEYSGSYYPRIMFIFTAALYNEDGGLIEDKETETDLSYWNPPPGYGGSGSVNFMGYNIPGFRFPDIPSYTGASIQPESYWSYGGTYNTSTGQPL